MVYLKLRELLKEKQLTQADLSKATGIRPSTICGIYNNNCTFIKLEHIDKICRVLHCNIDDLVVIIPSDKHY